MTIVFTGKNLHDVFQQQGVKAILKDDEGRPVLVLDPRYVEQGSHPVVFVGDIIENTNGKWKVIRRIENKVKL